jgi:ribonuclease BN (tRNA processing enzyme)
MKLVFFGAGEAFHDFKGNISMLAMGEKNLLLDCGYNIPQRFWQAYPDKDFLDAVFVSHFHGDHVAGLPMLVMRMRQDKRTKPLLLIGPEGFEASFKRLYDTLYKGFLEVSGFPIEFKEIRGGSKLSVGSMNLSFADASHLVGTQFFVPTAAIRVDSDGSSFCYSSDTTYTDRIAELAKGCNMLIHDSFMPASAEYHKRMPAHSSPTDAGRVAKYAGVKRLALFNIHRTLGDAAALKEAGSEFDGEIVTPSEGDSFDI